MVAGRLLSFACALPILACSSTSQPAFSPTDAAAEASPSCGESGAPGACPASQPSGGDSCDACGLVCCYGDTRCGGGTQVSCVDGRWVLAADACGGTAGDGVCPVAPPAPGSACSPCDEGLACDYSCDEGSGAAQNAQCSAGTWAVARSACADASPPREAGVDAPPDAPADAPPDSSLDAAKD